MRKRMMRPPLQQKLQPCRRVFRYLFRVPIFLTLFLLMMNLQSHVWRVRHPMMRPHARRHHLCMA